MTPIARAAVLLAALVGLLGEGCRTQVSRPQPVAPEPTAPTAPIATVGAVEAAPPPPVDAPPAAPSESAARSFELVGASKLYDFRLTFEAGCPEPEKGETCAGPADLVVARKDRSSSQKIHLEEAMVISDPNGVPLVNASALYDEPGTVIVGDFNFDGREDFALLANESGSYGGPTFHVFLASKSGAFVRSKELSEITESTLGLFQVDAKKKRLVTFAKSGCCFHVTEELAIVNDKPVVMSRVTEDGTHGDRLLVTRERRVGGRLQKTVTREAMPK